MIHGAYFAMFHAARAALLAVQGAASTKHGQVAASFARISAEQGLPESASVLAKGHDLHARPHHRNVDLTMHGRALRAQVRPFLALCARLVEERAGA